MLVALGAPLGNVCAAPKKPVDMMAALVGSLKLARQDPTVTRCLPVVIFKNKSFFEEKENLEKLAELSGERQALGFFLELTGDLSGENSLKHSAERLRSSQQREQEATFFFPQKKNNPYARRVAERNTPSAAKHWGFLLNEGLESFEKLFRSFANTPH